MPLDEFGREIPGIATFASSSALPAVVHRSATTFHDNTNGYDDDAGNHHTANLHSSDNASHQWVEDADMNDKERDRILQRQRHELLLQQRDAADDYSKSPPSSPAAESLSRIHHRRRRRSRSRSYDDGGKSLHQHHSNSYHDRRSGRYRHDSYGSHGAEKRQRHHGHDPSYDHDSRYHRNRRGDDGSRSSSRSLSPFGSTSRRSSSHRRMRMRRSRRESSPPSSGGGARGESLKSFSSLYSVRGERSHNRGNTSVAALNGKDHPSLRYTDEPLLCQRLFRNHQELNQEAETTRLKSELESSSYRNESNQGSMDVGHHLQDQPMATRTATKVATATTSVGGIDDNPSSPNAVLDANNDDIIMNGTTMQNTLKEQQQLEQYMSYNKARCLKYVRSFFNHHMDDEWFRQRYSPLEYKRKVQNHRERAVLEAFAILEEVEASIQEFQREQDKGLFNGNGADYSKGEIAQGEHLTTRNVGTSNVPSFVLHARLGGGVKPSKSRDSTNAAAAALSDHHHAKKRKYSSTLDAPHYDMLASSGIPKSHLFSFLQQDTSLHIIDVPSNVTDNHIIMALRDHADGNLELFPVRIMSGDVVEGPCEAIRKTMIVNDDDEYDDNGNSDVLEVVGRDGTDKPSLYHGSGIGQGASMQSDKDSMIVPKVSKSYLRSTWVLFQSAAAKQKVLKSIIGAHMENLERRHKEDHHSIPREVELFVDCSDPYGRYEIDADGKGNAPVLTTQNLSAGLDQDAEKKSHMTAQRTHASVYVSTVSPLESQTVTVLSAAVSSMSRIKKDKESAIEIAKKMDIQKNIPPEACLEAILKRLFPSNFKNENSDESTSQDDEDVLDTAIAYLRRVHLFTFYNGCYAAENIGNCLTTGHPTSVVHQRLKNADAILKKMQDENEIMHDDLAADHHYREETNTIVSKEATASDKNESKDMLVMRLDDSISKALSRLPDVLMMPSPFVVNETVDVIASEIESLEEKMKKEWLQNHSVIDSDNRARCSFHFCRKLFKDETFLRKHLLKKHKEFLCAELAKCHDPYMMKWWDEEAIRPVPMILIDCGSKFGYIPSLVCGAAEPCAQDPEPEMWKKEQERILKEKERDALILHRRALADSVENSQKYVANRGIEERVAVPTNTFIDVDDMKDEKVELSFSEVEVTQQSKKKKKKKKLL